MEVEEGGSERPQGEGHPISESAVLSGGTP